MKKLLLVIIALTLFIGFGCGKNQQAPEQKKDNSGEVKTDNKTPEKNGDIKKEETKTDGNDLGLKSGLPADYPKDIPVPPNSTCHGSIYNQSEGTTVTFVSKVKPMEIANFYKEEMKKNGFQLETGSEELMNDKGGMLKWTKDKREVEVMMSFKTESSDTDIVLSYKEKK
jgi:hypothetical protein